MTAICAKRTSGVDPERILKIFATSAGILQD
jgi:hypothetical protein